MRSSRGTASSSSPRRSSAGNGRRRGRRPLSTPIPGRFLLCPGFLAGAHEPLALPIMQGQKQRFVFCPIPHCHIRSFLGGSHYHGQAPGFTIEQIRARYPNVVMLGSPPVEDPPHGRKA